MINDKRSDNSHLSPKRRVLDPTALRSLYEMGEEDLDFLADMIDSFLSTQSDLLERLKTSIATNDFDQARLVAHTLKSGSTDMGATDLKEGFATLEAHAKAGDLADADHLISEIETRLPAIISQLQDILQAARNGSLAFDELD